MMRNRKNQGVSDGATLHVLMLSILSLIAASAFAADEKKPAAVQPQAAQQQPAGSGITQEKSFPKITSGKWTGPKLPDGQPDVHGDWSNTIANHNNFTDPQGGIPNDPAPRRTPLGPRDDRAPSRVSDPADGQVPFQPWALAKVKLFQVGFHNPTEPQYTEPLARCSPGGIPKSFYWHGYEIAQYPGYVVFSSIQVRALSTWMENRIYPITLSYGTAIHAALGR